MEWLAVLGACLFAGAATYINVAEHPARMQLQPHDAVRQWAFSYKRATWMQAPLAVMSCLAGLGVWLLRGGGAWLFAAVLIGSVVPFTFLGIMPTNRRLLSGGLPPGSARALLLRWRNLHGVRTLLSLAAAGLYTWLVARS